MDQFDDAAVMGLADKFRSGQPFPHLVLEDMIAADQDVVVSGFPSLDWPDWTLRTDSYQRGKRSCSDIGKIPDVPKSMLQELQEPGFLRFLERVTGVEKLLVDPYLAGGGLHCTGPGGKLSAHIDFHHYKELWLYRRLNVLLYLNPSWGEDDGGQLQLFRKGETEPQLSVTPRYGTCVIFKTDDQSVHGVTPVTADVEPRRSLAVYYYTSYDAAVFSGGTATYWQDEASIGSSLMHRVRLGATKTLVLASRACAKASHKLDPNHQA